MKGINPDLKSRLDKYGPIGFMNDSTEGKDGHKEAIMDFMVSWTLRRAQNCCADEKPKLYKYCRRFLSLVLDQEIVESDEVYVETWKQESYIDLWVYVKINGTEYDILIEDKYYSGLRGDQLDRYRKYFDEWCSNNRTKTKRRYLLLSCMDSDGATIYNDISPFRILSWDDMTDAMGCNEKSLSESDLFNEFWILWK